MAAVTEQPSASTYRLTEDQQMLRDAVRVLADEQIAPRAAAGRFLLGPPRAHPRGR